MGTDLKGIEMFERQYTALNSAQKKAVDTIEGPVMVIAGPGTGKTQILALRIANILRNTDADPSSILSLTFTESGVASMRARLVSLMGQEGYRVRIHTFHGFCNEVIRAYPDKFPTIVGRTPLIGLDAIRIIKEIIDRERPKLLRPHGKPDFYVRDIIGKISETKREHIPPVDLRKRIEDARAEIERADDLYHSKGAHVGKMKGHYLKALSSLEKATEFLLVYEAYETALETEGYYDFDDTIIAVVEALARDEELKLILQEEHQYILADEHQDANGSQNELLALLSDFHEQPNLFIVGDEKQAIYRFQGASLENFFSFKDRYPKAVLISLSDNYRSTQSILDAAHKLIAPARTLEDVERVELAARAPHLNERISCMRATDEDSEHSYISEQIAKHISGGVAAHELAVLVRRNADIPALASALSRRNIPFVAHGDDPVLAHPLVQSFITYLYAVAYYGEDNVLYPALSVPFSKIPNLDIYRITSAPLYKPGALTELLGDRDALSALGVKDVDACISFSSTLSGSVKAIRALPMVTAAEHILWKSGCMAHMLSQNDALKELDMMRTLFRYMSALCDAHPSYTVKEMLNALAEAKEYRLSLGSTPYRREGAVSLMTVHRAKGMEFDHVFIPHVHDRLWGAKRAIDRIALPLFAAADGSVEDDERRLFYVAMTRARKSLTFSYATTSTEGSLQIPSRFLEELKEGAHISEEEIAGTGTFFVAPPEAVTRETLTDEEKTYLRSRLAEQGLSVSALNNYLESPWKYFFINLLRIPQARAPHLLYGTAVDETLKWYTSERKRGTTPPADEVSRVFTSALGRQPLMKKDFETYRIRGVEALAGYLAQYADSWWSDAESAVAFRLPFETGFENLPIITLKGELDKVEHVEPGVVRVVDYKTGKPKTRGEIEGTTKTSNGNMKRQLTFYRMLVERDETREWRTEEGVLDFVEPDAKGKYHRETFSLTREDVMSLEETIRSAIRDIYEFAFWDTACDEATWSADGCTLVAAIKERKSLFS